MKQPAKAFASPNLESQTGALASKHPKNPLDAAPRTGLA
jgi:hypothetical protein